MTEILGSPGFNESDPSDLDLDEVMTLLEEDDLADEAANKEVDLSESLEPAVSDTEMLNLSEDDVAVAPEHLHQEDFLLDKSMVAELVVEEDSLDEDDDDDFFGDLMPKTIITIEPEPDEPQRETTWEQDLDHTKFLGHVADKIKSMPQHSGTTTVGCEKLISYLRKLDRDISKAVQSDEKNVIDEVKAEKYRDVIHNYIGQLEEALEALTTKKRGKKVKKKSSLVIGKQIVSRIKDGTNAEYFISVADGEDDEQLFKVEIVEPSDDQITAFLSGEGITKEAAHLATFVDPFLQSITRLLIRSHVTHGKNLRDVYQQLHEQYSFTDREQLSIHELLLQKGLPPLADLGRIQEGKINQLDGKGVDHSVSYPA